MKITRNVLAVAAAVGVAAAGGSAFTAGNTTTPTVSAGSASTVTAGFAVSNVVYTLGNAGGDTGDDVTTIAFRLTPDAAPANPANSVRIRVTAASAYVTACVKAEATPALGDATNWTCTLGPVKVSALTRLEIVAVSTTPSAV